MKKLTGILIIIICFVLSFGTVLADETGANVKRDLQWYITQSADDFAREENPLAETEPFLVDITNPELEDGCMWVLYTNALPKSFTLYGYLKNPNAKVIVSFFNEQEKKYEEMRFSDEYRGIRDIRGCFAQDIELVPGRKKFKVVAYLDTAIDNPEYGKNIQITYFSIKYKPSGNRTTHKGSDRRFTVDVLQQVNKSLSGG